MFVANLQCNTIYLTLLSLFDIYVFQNLREITHFKLSVSTMWAFFTEFTEFTLTFIFKSFLNQHIKTYLAGMVIESLSNKISVKFVVRFHLYFEKEKKENINGQTKDYIKIGICCFSAKHATLRRKNKDWLARNHDNVSELGDTSVRKLLFQWASNMKIQLSVLV